MRNFVFVFLAIVKLASSQTYDTINLRSIHLNEFCLGDSKECLYEIFGKPSKIDLKVVDDAIENCEPSKNIYYYGENYFSEPYLVAEGRIGEFYISSQTGNIKLKVYLEKQEYTFELGDTLKVEELENFFPNSMKFSKERFMKKGTGFIPLYFKVSKQEEYFPYPYPLIRILSIYYKDMIVQSYMTYYYIE